MSNEEATVDVVARLRTRDGAEIAHACSFSLEEWQLLERFAVYAETELMRTTLVATPSDLGFSLAAGDDGLKFTVSVPEADDVRALLMVMRPFLLKDEPTNFGRVRNILARRLDHSAFKTYLERQKEIFDGRRWQAFLAVSDGTVINSSGTLNDWLNAYEYHRDEEKRAALEALHRDDAMPFALSRAMFIGMMLDKARAVIEIRSAFRAIQQAALVIPLPGD